MILLAKLKRPYGTDYVVTQRNLRDNLFTIRSFIVFVELGLFGIVARVWIVADASMTAAGAVVAGVGVLFLNGAIGGFIVAMLVITVLAIAVVMAFVTIIPVVILVIIALMPIAFLVVMMAVILIIIPIMMPVMAGDAEILTRVNPVDIVDTVHAANGVDVHTVAGGNAGQSIAAMNIVVRFAHHTVIVPAITIVVGIN